MLVASILITVGTYLYITISNAPQISTLDAVPKGYRSSVLDDEGNIVLTLSQESSNRVYVKLAEIPDDLQHAVDILGTRGAFAYPYGDVSDVSAAAIERVGILCSFTTDYDQVYPGDDPTRLSRIRVSGGEGLEYYQGSVW